MDQVCRTDEMEWPLSLFLCTFIVEMKVGWRDVGGKQQELNATNQPASQPANDGYGLRRIFESSLKTIVLFCTRSLERLYTLLLRDEYT
jgi:hypothetical protein